MTWLRRVRPGLYLLGVALVIGSLVGARALTAGNGSNSNNEPKTANPNYAVKAAGPIVLGTVDSDPSPVWYGLPPVLQSGTIVERFVNDRKEVKAGDPLYKFDTSLQECDLVRAQAAVGVAKAKVAAAQEKARQHTDDIANMEKAVAAAQTGEQIKGEAYKLTKRNLEEFWRSQKKVDGSNYTEAEIKQKLDNDIQVFNAQVAYAIARDELELKKAQLAALKVANLQVLVKEAEANVKLVEEEVKKAQIAIDLCTVKAKTAGTIERVTIGPGTTIGVGTREPALWLVPAGPRIVRAEVEAEFAHRVGKEIEGKEVTIFDNTDPRLTYKGTVRGIGDTFLPKRSANEGLLGNDTRVLEVLIEVLDPAPAGQPPLRVGQRVRVSLGN
jgi:multidrug resistance efflux pump